MRGKTSHERLRGIAQGSRPLRHKSTSFTGARQKIPQKSRRSVKRAFLSVGQNFPPAAGQTFRQITTRTPFIIGAQKSSGSVPTEFSPRGVGNKRRSAAMRGKKSSGCLAHRGTLRPFPSGCGVFPPPRPCVAISSIPVCDERQKLFIGGCAVSRKADACCVRKARFSPGRAAKKFCGCVFAAAFSKKNPSAGNRGGIHFFLIRYMFLLR